MELYILRHGEAEPRDSGIADEDRALVKKGKADVRAVCEAALRANVEPQLILTSPLRRARETAEIAARVFKECPLQETDAMLPGADPREIWNESLGLRMERVLAVGHEPHVGTLLSFLLGSDIAVDFKKGALVRIDVQGKGKPRGVLKWVLTPRLARAL